MMARVRSVLPWLVSTFAVHCFEQFCLSILTVLMNLSEVGDRFRQEGMDEVIPREGDVATEICLAIFQALVGCYLDPYYQLY